MIRVEINVQTKHPVDKRLLRKAARAVLKQEHIDGIISLALVDDHTIRQLNHQYLGHDVATDVLSFVLERTDDYLEGEVIASAEMALRSAPRYGWSPGDELLLYVIHGLLHLVGYDDQNAPDRARMRRRERYFLDQLGIKRPDRAQRGGGVCLGTAKPGPRQGDGPT